MLALQPEKAGCERLCSRDATLLSADEVFTFIINELNELIEQKFCICKDDERFVKQRDQREEKYNIGGTTISES